MPQGMSEKELKQFRSMNYMLRYIDRDKWIPPTHRAAMVMLDCDQYVGHLPPFFINPAIGLLIDNMESTLPVSLLGASWRRNVLPVLCMSRSVENKAVHDAVVGDWFIKTVIPAFIRSAPPRWPIYGDLAYALDQLTKEGTNWTEVLSNPSLKLWTVRMFCSKATWAYECYKEGKYYATPYFIFDAVSCLVETAKENGFDQQFNWETISIWGLMVDLMQLVESSTLSDLVIGDTKIQKTKSGGVGITQRKTDVSVYDQISLAPSTARKFAKWILDNTEETDEEVN